MPKLLRKAYRNLAGIAALQKSDILFPSFPKSGSTWVRFFLCNLISLSEWDGADFDYVTLDNTMPEIGFNDLFMSWNHKIIPRVIKTHKHCWPPFKGHKTVLLIRDPRDTMISFFSYETQRKKTRFDGTFPEFLRHPKFGLRAWFRHYLSWVPQSSLVLKYEELKKDEIREFTKLLNVLNVDASSTLILQAAERSSLSRMRELELKVGNSRQSDFINSFRFFGAGKSEAWKASFSPSDLLLYESLCNEFRTNIYP